MKEATEFCIEYMGNPEAYSVTTRKIFKLLIDYNFLFSESMPGFLYKTMSSTMPTNSESFNQVLKDVYKFILPGVSFLYFYILKYHLNYKKFKKKFLVNSLATSSLSCLFSGWV